MTNKAILGVGPMEWATMSQRSRRDFLRLFFTGAGALAASSLLAACSGEDATTSASGTGGGEVTVSVWGGETEQAFRTTVVPRFKELTGANVKFELGSGGDRFSKLLAQKGSPSVDIFINTGENVVQAYRQGLLRDFDEALVPNFKSLADWARPAAYGAYGASYGLVVYGLVTANQRVDSPLTSWRDLWRKDLQGHLALPNIPHSAMTQFLIVVSELNGGSIDDIEPGLAALSELDPALLTFFWTDWAPAVQSGEVWAATEYDYEVVSMLNEEFDVQYNYPEEKGLAAGNIMSIVDREGNAELAHEFVDLTLDSEVNSDFCAIWHGSPANQQAVIRPEIEGLVYLANEILDKVRFFDDAELADRRAEWTQQLETDVLPAWE